MKPTDVATDTEITNAEKLDPFISNFDQKIPIYFMHLRRGNRPPEVKYFQLDGNISKAILRSRTYCDRMGYRFCGVFPFLTDLDKEEKAQSDGTFVSERS